MLHFPNRTLIMGILNTTPDSFSDGGKHDSLSTALDHAKKMIDEGVDIIDIGGESTRPGALKVTEEEELSRVIPVIKSLKGINTLLSIDTYKSGVAKSALEAGADILNDIWGLQGDEKMAHVAAKYDAPIIAMHNQIGTEYTQDIIASMILFFEKTLDIASKAGIKKEKIIFDPGIGFGKTAEQNIEVMRRLKELHVLECPLLLGTSRKSMIGHILDLPVNERLEGTLATSVIGIEAGVSILRVHDVRENLRAAKVADAIYKSPL